MLLAPYRFGSVAVITVNPDTYQQDVIDPADASASVSFNSNGTVTITGDTGTPYNWRVGGNSADYSIIFQTSTGTPSSGTADAWLPLSTSRDLGVVRTTIGTKSWTGTVKIRRDSDMTILASAAISLTAFVDTSL